MTSHIETPYGRKSPELLCKAMDLHVMLPAIILTLQSLKSCCSVGRDDKEHASATTLIRMLEVLL